jgi:acyl-CoA synthetase (AMP-forming)/AMP-acid ligase II
MYIRGGYNVYPMEVESVLVDHPSVAEVCVISRPDDVMGEVGVACVVAVNGAPAPSLNELRAFAATRLSHHKLPERLRLCAELPRNASDKVDRRQLIADDAHF